MDYETSLGINPKTGGNVNKGKEFFEYVNMRLSAFGAPIYGKPSDYPLLTLAEPLVENYRECVRDRAGKPCPADARIMHFLSDYFSDITESREEIPPLPLAFELDRYGVARVLSIPPDVDSYHNDYVHSYRIKQGVLHNPKSDRRTTEGVFHVAEGGLPIPDDKKAVPKHVFKNLYKAALLDAPESLLDLPFTSTQQEQGKIWVSLLLRPIVCPHVPNGEPEKSMEVRFFAPGGLVSNLDFVESIFGNAGNPFLRKNDASANHETWTGHTGCVILAPHLAKLTKKSVGLPHIDDATERQKRDGMCWSDENEIYNGGEAFKVTARDENGVIVTIIADNYFGYSKKEVKTQISFSANLYGQCEEEHSGGALAYSSRDLGDDFYLGSYTAGRGRTFAEALEILGDDVDVFSDGWAIDKRYPDIVYVNENAYFSLKTQRITWQKDGEEKSIRLVPGNTYISPYGYKIEMMRPHEQRRWRLVGTTEEGTYCHKPATVSGGGKSEISKDITDALIHGPSFVADFKRDIEAVAFIINKNYGERNKDPSQNKGADSRPILDERRTMGSVVKLLTPSEDFTDEYNAWLETIPFYIREFVLTVKRHFRPEWDGDWQSKFTVDTINGAGGNILKYKDANVLSSYLRIGFTEDGSWRTFSLRKDFFPSTKIQLEDDITSSVVVPSDSVDYLPEGFSARHPSVKFTENCEYRLFQRPDEAVIRGYDKRAELDMSEDGSFISNYEPLTRDQVRAMSEDVLRFYNFTAPMRRNLEDFLKHGKPQFVVASSEPRLVNGKPTKNQRYLQNRDDMVNPRKYYLCDVGARLARKIPGGRDIPHPVSSVISGRRNNPASDGVRPLAVHNPIHYLEYPEAFMEYIASMTGKSPSTTGAGLEGAMTKGPFNALCAITDLNNALVSFALCSYNVWLSSAGYIGPKYRVDHDISLLIPEIWSRMRPSERSIKHLMEHGMIERCRDMEHNGKAVFASRLGWRITKEFVKAYFGRVFSNPASIFAEDMLKPELQDMDTFADGMDNMVGAHKRAAEAYFADGSIEGACPPLKALLYIMKDGHYEGKGLDDDGIRAMFTRESIITSEWYAERLMTKQQRDMNSYQKILHELHADQLQNAEEIAEVNARMKTCKSFNTLKSLAGTLGTDPFLYS